MEFNFKPMTRRVIYAVAGVVNLVTMYLATVGAIGAAEVVLINGVNVFVCGLAGLNVPTQED